MGRFGIQPNVIDHLPIDRAEAYLGGVTPEVMTFADEAALHRYFMSQGQPLPQ